MKKGFTLIELLAVLVLMGIIVSIVYVRVDKKMAKAEEVSLTESAKNYFDSVKMRFLNVDLTSSELKPGTYNVTEQTVIDGVTYESLNNLIELKENKPKGGTVTIDEEGNVTDATLKIRKFIVNYTNGTFTIEEEQEV